MSRRHRYFYNAIDGTPFSLGIAIPEGYGMYEVLGEQEIKHSPVNGKCLLIFILFRVFLGALKKKNSFSFFI